MLYTVICGIFFSSKSFNSSWSACCSPLSASTTRMAMSVLSRTCRARFTRISPRVPTSSIPGVSMMTTGPMGRSSMAFCTGSVVVPLVSETRDKLWPVTAFTTLDFPAFRRPKKPMWTRSADTLSFSPIVVSSFLNHISFSSKNAGSLIRTGNPGGWMP